MIIPSFFAADVHTHIINSSSITSQVKTQQAFWPMFCTFNSGDSGEQRSVWNKSLLCSPHLENRWPSLCWSEVQMEQACAATTHFFRRLRWSVAALKFCFVVSALGVYLQGKPRNIQNTSTPVHWKRGTSSLCASWSKCCAYRFALRFWRRWSCTVKRPFL